VFNHFTPLDLDLNAGDINLGYPLKVGTADVNSMARLMGIFWADNAKNSNGVKRSQIGQARETTANQALAAILNSAMPGGAPLPEFKGLQLDIDRIRTILSSNIVKDIKDLGAALDAYNNLGDNIALDPSLPSTGHADPKTAKNVIGDIPWADSP